MAHGFQLHLLPGCGKLRPDAADALAAAICHSYMRNENGVGGRCHCGALQTEALLVGGDLHTAKRLPVIFAPGSRSCFDTK